MAKQLNVSLAFQADTSQARAQIQGLVNELNKLSSVGTQSMGTEKLTSGIIEAKMAAKDLGVMLEQSFNVDTGKLDLNKFNSSLKKSGMSLTDYGNKMAMLGTQGDQAFLKIAQSIVETEVPLRRSSGLLKEFGTTLANTARWQISSSILHGFMGSVQKAYGYAQDLNESLNNIRIVTGQNSDQMALFAERANKAAKALSTTTTDYTNASLIYYQQGLNDQEVQERTDITVKMANVAGQSAETVSDQLTAVWNNFDDGTKSLEHYADVMTALGAATASSTDEIADGLEKFAAVADTVGLSYEYAASALATVTATTRQSADVVGTAFKTLFARIEGLELGETLDDGTTLNKYSEALMAVGVNIKDSNGEMKEMDTILTEMAAKWDTLNKDQQIALAQTVAGVRQYTQLIALMDNWDFMEENLATSANSTGALDEQQKIYEESWAASQDRVKASMEGIFDSVIEDDFFIGLNNVLADTLGVVEKLVDAMGGMPGVLSLVGILVTSIFKDQLANGINNAIHNMKNFAGVSHLEMDQLKQEAYEYAQTMIKGLADTSPGFKAQAEHLSRVYQLQKLTKEALREANAEQAEAIQEVYNQANAYSEVAVQAGKAADEAQRLYEEQQKTEGKKYGIASQKDMQLSADLSVGLTGTDLLREAKNIETLALEMEGLGDETSELQGKINEYKAALKSGNEEKIIEAGDKLRTSMEQTAEAARFQAEAFTAYQSVLSYATTDVLDIEDKVTALQETLSDNSPNTDQIESIRELTIQMQTLGYPVEDIINAFKRYDAVIDSGDTDQIANATKDLGRNFSSLKISVEDSEKAIKKQAIAYTGADKTGRKYSTALNETDKKLDEITRGSRNAEKSLRNFSSATETAKQSQKDFQKKLKNAQTSIKNFGTGASSAIQGVSSLGMAFSSMKGVIDTLSDPDTSGFEKFLSVLTSSGMIVGSLTSGFSQISRGFKDMASAADGSTISLLTQAMQMKANEIQENSFIHRVKEGIAARKLEIATSQGAVTSKLMEAGATEIAEESEEELNEEKQKNIKTTLGMIISAMADATAKTGEAGATLGAAGAQTALNVALGPFIGLLGAIIPLIGAIVVQMLPFIAAAGVLALAITGIAYAATAESRALEEAKEKEEAAAESAKRVADEINGINQSLDTISSKTKSFEDLEKGTMDWSQAFHEVNSEVQNLIDKYPELIQMGFITKNSDGLLGITEEGIDYISKENEKRQMAATNTQLKAKQDTAQVAIDNNWNDFQAVAAIGNSYSKLNEGGAKALVASYQAYGDAMFENIEYAKAAFNNVNSMLPKEEQQVRATDEAIQKFINHNKDLIKSQAENLNQIDQLEKQIIQNRLISYGSNRTVEQAKELMGNTKFSSISGSGNSRKLNYTTNDGSQKSFNMNKHDNYTNENMPQEIKDFMELQNGEYVAQRWGKLVLEVDGEEVEFSEDEVYNALGELYSGESFEKRLRDNLIQSLGNAANGLEDVATEDLVRLDNLNLGFQEAFDGDVEAANEAFQKIVGAYGNTKESLIQLSQDTQYIDMTSAAFQRLAGDAYLSGEQMKTAIQELNAIGKIESMGSWFGEQAESLGLNAEEAQNMQDYAKHLMKIADESEELSDDLDENAEAAAELAVQVSKMNRGINTLANNFEDWSSILKKSSKSSAEYSKAMSDMKKALSDILDVEEDFISIDFVTNNLEDIEKAATGDAEAIDRLHQALAQQIVLDIVGVDKFEDLPTDLQIALNNMQSLIDNTHLDIGESISLDADGIDQSGFIDACNEIIKSAGMTAEQANAYFDALGFETKFKTEEQEIEQKTPKTVTKTEVSGYTSGTATGPDGKPREWEYPILNTWTYTDGYETETGTMEAIAMSTDGNVPQIESITKKATSSMNNYSSSNSGGKSPGSGGSKGGSGSKPKKVKETKKSDIIDRYKEIEDQLDNVRDAQDKASKSAERLYGIARLEEMDKINKALEKEVDLLKDKKKEAEAYLKTDKAELEKATAESGISFTFDSETGDITNYTSEMTKLYDQLHAAEVSANADGNATEEEQEKIDKINEKIEAVKAAYDQYEETKNLVEDLDSEIMDKIHEIQDNRFEKLNYKFEIKIEISENSLKWIDYQLEKLEDDFYSAAEAAALFFDISNQKGTKYGQTLEQIKITTQQFAEAEKMYNSFDENGNRLISQANYIEAMNQARDSYYNQLAALQEIDDAMMNYYSETLDKASEELAKYIDQMEHLNSVMDHYSSLMSIMGREKDYESMGIILEGQASLAEDRLKAAESTFKMFANEKDEAYSKWQQALKDGNTAAAELYEKEYQAALQKANEAEEEFLASAEETIEAWKAVLENSLEEMGSNLEKALTGGRTFDQMSATMERINSIHEEYLTTTNKIYETNKMMRTVQQEIDKTSNTAAKRRLKQFIEQTQELQDQKVLSQFELDIQKAKYDLLLAEIALEEAQNAKSQVRLQRDSEGNFGYVYTADTSAVDDAQQKFEDAQNNLYNISLDGANKYAEQRQVLMQEMYDQMRELQTQYLNGEFANEEEYNKALDELKTYYYEKLRQASELYNVAISADSDAAAENILGDSHLVASGALGDFDTIAKKWQNTLLVTMDKDTSDWKEKVEKYLLGVNKAFTDWSNNCEAISKKTHLDKLAEKTEAIKTESKNLVTEMTKKDGVLETLKKEFDAVKLVTDEYARNRREVQGLVGDIEGYITALDKKQDAEGKKKSEETKTGNKQEEQKPKAEEKPKVEEKPKPKKISADRIQEGFDLIMAGAWGKGWDNRKKKALAAGFTEEEFELIKKKIDQYFASNTPKPTKSATISVTSQPTAPYTTFTATSYAKNWMSFDTGGYTGNWEGPYGKLAMLHKKELVLNERDTANFLASMEVLERILSIIDLQSANAQYIGAINSPALKSTGQDTLEQNVHIEASFPNVTDRNEIEEAFKDIVNLASQYANRK